MKTILCFGDSITFGEKDLIHGGWVELLKLAYFKSESSNLFQNTLIYNLGIASETTDGLMRRVENEIKARKIGRGELVVIFSYGYNDIQIHKNKNLVPQAYFERNISRAIDIALSIGARVFMMNMSMLNEKIDGVSDCCNKLRFSCDLLAYNKIIESLCFKDGVNLINIFSALNDIDDIHAEDRLHLNSKGHQVIFEKVNAVLL